MLGWTCIFQQLSQGEQGLLQSLVIQRVADGEANRLGGREVSGRKEFGSGNTDSGSLAGLDESGRPPVSWKLEPGMHAALLVVQREMTQVVAQQARSLC